MMETVEVLDTYHLRTSTWEAELKKFAGVTAAEGVQVVYVRRG
jgi:hypothetical protein